MKIEIVDSIEKLLSYKAQWENILKEMNSDNVFLELDWIITRWKYLEGKYKPLILIVKKDREVIGICPLMVINRGICNEISFIGSRESGCNDFILRDKYREKALECIFNYLRDLKGKNIIKLNVLSMKSANYTLLKEYLKAYKVLFVSNVIVHYFISSEDKDFNTYLENRFSKNSRRIMKNKENKLKSLGDLSYKRLSPEEIDEVFEIHDKRWLRKIGNSSFSKGSTKEFYKELALNKNTRFKITVDAITLNNKVLSFIYGIEYNGKALLLRIAHDDDFYFLSPGELVWKKKIEDCFLSHMRVVDFGPGYEPYKAKWTDEFEDFFTAVLPSDNLQSVLVFYIKYLTGIKLINALKKNKRIYYFKKYYLGKLKLLFSREHISDKFIKIKNAVEQNGLSVYIANKFIDYTGAIYGHKKYLILGKYLNITEIPQSNLKVKEAAIDDVDELSEVMNISASNIIRRLVNKHQCYITTCNNEIIHYCWINCSKIELSGAELKLPFEKSEAHIYDALMKRKYRIKDNYIYIFSNIFNQLCKNNYKKCYITLDCSNKTLENEIYKEIFNSKYEILEKRLLGTTRHCIVDLQFNDKGKV